MTSMITIKQKLIRLSLGILLAVSLYGMEPVFAADQSQQSTHLINLNLLQSAERGILSEVLSALNQGADPNSVTESQENTALHLLAQKGYLYCDAIPLATALLNAGAKINAVNIYRLTPLDYALRSDRSIIEPFINFLKNNGGLVGIDLSDILPCYIQ